MTPAGNAKIYLLQQTKALILSAVIRGFAGDGDAVRVAFFQARISDFYELAILVHFFDIFISRITHC